MKRTALLLGGLCAAFSLSAATWNLYKGTSIVKPKADYASLDDCNFAARKGAPGKYTCRSLSIVPIDVPPPIDMHAGMAVDPKTIPAPVKGVTDQRISATTQLPNPSDEGGFRTVCTLTKVLPDDPIVFPGQPGASHLHNFFGNDAVDGNTATLTGGSSCRGGAANLSAYWQPAVIDGTRWVAPQSMINYYKNGSRLPATTVFHVVPTGLKMVAGNPSAKTAEESGGLWTCVDASGSGAHSASIPACAPGNTLWASVEFPQCWDGKNLDAADHRSHMSYPVQLQQFPFTWSCPTTHPVAIPLITVNVLYAVQPGEDTTKWRVASDMYTGPGGFSLHADWFNGWRPEVMAAWVANCNNARKDCFAHLLGDGRQLDSFGGN